MIKYTLRREGNFFDDNRHQHFLLSYQKFNLSVEQIFLDLKILNEYFYGDMTFFGHQI